MNFYNQDEASNLHKNPYEIRYTLCLRAATYYSYNIFFKIWREFNKKILCTYIFTNNSPLLFLDPYKSTYDYTFVRKSNWTTIFRFFLETEIQIVTANGILEIYTKTCPGISIYRYYKLLLLIDKGLTYLFASLFLK